MLQRIWITGPFAIVAFAGLAFSQDPSIAGSHGEQGMRGGPKFLLLTTTSAPATIGPTTSTQAVAFQISLTTPTTTQITYAAVLANKTKVSFAADGSLTLHSGGVLVSDVLPISFRDSLRSKIGPYPLGMAWLRSKHIIAGADGCAFALRNYSDAFGNEWTEAYLLVGNRVWVHGRNAYTSTQPDRCVVIEENQFPTTQMVDDIDYSWLHSMQCAAKAAGFPEFASSQPCP